MVVVEWPVSWMRLLWWLLLLVSGEINTSWFFNTVESIRRRRCRSGVVDVGGPRKQFLVVITVEAATGIHEAQIINICSGSYYRLRLWLWLWLLLLCWPETVF